MKKHDLKDKRFGRLMVTSRRSKDRNGKMAWECLCDCGCSVLVPSHRLISGNTRSCGCLKREVDKTHFLNCKTHGKTDSRVYNSWVDMIRRCKDPKRQNYKNYGAKGVTVCESWKKFENFYKDMGDPPDNYTLDRINNNVGYRKDNCRWATKAEQTQNRTITKLTPQDVLRIREMKSLGEPVVKLIDIFHISQSHIYRMINGKSWANVK